MPLTPPPPCVRMCPLLTNPPSPLGCGRPLWMAPYQCTVMKLSQNVFGYTLIQYCSVRCQNNSYTQYTQSYCELSSYTRVGDVCTCPETVNGDVTSRHMTMTRALFVIIEHISCVSLNRFVFPRLCLSGSFSQLLNCSIVLCTYEFSVIAYF